jgi:hypothetical protein
MCVCIDYFVLYVGVWKGLGSRYESNDDDDASCVYWKTCIYLLVHVPGIALSLCPSIAYYQCVYNKRDQPLKYI